MDKHEFEQHAKCKVTEEQYADIEFVYAFHPAIDEVKGKEQIAKLYNMGGMGIIYAMMTIAKAEEERNNERHRLINERDKLNERIEWLNAETKMVKRMWNLPL